MLKLSENKTALINLHVTIEAIQSLDYLIKEYQQPKLGPAHCELNYVAKEHSNIHIDREIMVNALQQQREKYADYLKTLNIDANA